MYIYDIFIMTIFYEEDTSPSAFFKQWTVSDELRRILLFCILLFLDG